LVASAVQGYHENKDVCFEGSDIASASGDRKIDVFACQVSTHAHANFLSRSQEFCKKNGDKFGWVKYWQMIFDSPKISPTTILHYIYSSIVHTYFFSYKYVYIFK